MRQAIRALSLVVNILWIVIVVFSVTALHSVMRLGMDVGEGQILPSNEGVVFRLPFFINNNGYYDISVFNLTTYITDYDGTLITFSETFVPLVPGGSSVEKTHDVPLSLNNIMSRNFTQLLFNDSLFDLGTITTLNFAHAIPIQVSTNVTMHWGAPFYNFSVVKNSPLPHNITHCKVVISPSFENHAVFDVTGIMQLEIYNDMNERVTSGTTHPDVPSQHEYDGQVNTYLSLVDLPRLTESGKVHVTFETPTYILEWWTPYG